MRRLLGRTNIEGRRGLFWWALKSTRGSGSCFCTEQEDRVRRGRDKQRPVRHQHRLQAASRMRSTHQPLRLAAGEGIGHTLQSTTRRKCLSEPGPRSCVMMFSKLTNWKANLVDCRKDHLTKRKSTFRMKKNLSLYKLQLNMNSSIFLNHNCTNLHKLCSKRCSGQVNAAAERPFQIRCCYAIFEIFHQNTLRGNLTRFSRPI